MDISMKISPKNFNIRNAEYIASRLRELLGYFPGQLILQMTNSNSVLTFFDDETGCWKPDPKDDRYSIRFTYKDKGSMYMNKTNFTASRPVTRYSVDTAVLDIVNFVLIELSNHGYDPLQLADAETLEYLYRHGLA